MIEAGLRAIGDLRRRLGRPHWVLPRRGALLAAPREGWPRRPCGIEERGFCLVTYLPSWLRERVIKAMDVYLLSRVTAPDELAFLSVSLPDIAASPGTFLAGGHAVPVAARQVRCRPAGPQRHPPERSRSSRRRAETMHVRHVKKYADSQVPPAQRFFFRNHDGRVVAAAESLHGFRHAVVAVPGDVLGLPRRPRRFLPMGFWTSSRIASWRASWILAWRGGAGARSLISAVPSTA